MSAVALASAHVGIASQIVSSATPSVERLVQRLVAEMNAAEQRVQARQTEPANVLAGQKHRLLRFVAVADRIHAILQPRLQAFTNVYAFKNIKQTVSQELRGSEGQGFHGRTTTLTVPYSDNRPTPMEFSFRVSYDGPMKNAVMDYRLAIFPIFIQFESHDQLIVPIDAPSEEIIAAWIDDKLIGFTNAYFKVYFNDGYQ